MEAKKKEGNILESVEIEEDEKTQIQMFEERIAKFLGSADEQQLVLRDLNAFERRIVHEICEKKDLNHESLGNGAKKNMVLSKKVKPVTQDLPLEETYE